jgi:Ca2+-binding EF-hand superfamily protein
LAKHIEETKVKSPGYGRRAAAEGLPGRESSLRREIEALAKDSYRHPVSHQTWASKKPSTIEEWTSSKQPVAFYYSGRKELEASRIREKVYSMKAEATRKSKSPTKRPKMTQEEWLVSLPLRSVHQRLQTAAYTACGKNFDKLFRIIDKDQSGTLTQQEFVHAMKRDFKIPSSELPTEKIITVFQMLDEDGGGEVSVDEIVRFLKHGPKSIPLSKLQEKVQERTATEVTRINTPPGSASPQWDDLDTTLPIVEENGPKELKCIHDKRRAIIQMHELLQQQAQSLISKDEMGRWNWDELFVRMDSNKDGQVSRDELEWCLRGILKIEVSVMPDDLIDTLFQLLDQDSSGDVSIEEFIDFIREGKSKLPEVWVHLFIPCRGIPAFCRWMCSYTDIRRSNPPSILLRIVTRKHSKVSTVVSTSKSTRRPRRKRLSLRLSPHMYVDALPRHAGSALLETDSMVQHVLSHHAPSSLLSTKCFEGHNLISCI